MKPIGHRFGAITSPEAVTGTPLSPRARRQDREVVDRFGQFDLRDISLFVNSFTAGCTPLPCAMPASDPRPVEPPVGPDCAGASEDPEMQASP